MKKMFNLLLCMVAGITISVLFSSCSNEDNPGEYSTSIVGIWEMQKEEGIEEGYPYVEDFANDPKYEDMAKEYWIFEADSKLLKGRVSSGNFKISRRCSWKISEADPSNIIITIDGISGYDTYQIESLNKNKLVVTFIYSSNWVITYTFKRVKSLPGYTDNDED